MNVAVGTITLLTPTQRAANCLANATTIQDAARNFEIDVRSDPELFSKVMEPYFSQACYDVIRACQRDRRRTIWDVTPADTSGRVVALARGNVNSLMDFPLPNGKRLAAATKEEVIEASGFFMRQANNMQQKGRWLELIGKRLKASQIVGDKLSEKVLVSLKGKAEE